MLVGLFLLQIAKNLKPVSFLKSLSIHPDFKIKLVESYCFVGVFTYFDYFQGCWIKSLALLHNFTVDSFVNLIPHKLKAHNVVLNFYGERT